MNLKMPMDEVHAFLRPKRLSSIWLFYLMAAGYTTHTYICTLYLTKISCRYMRSREGLFVRGRAGRGGKLSGSSILKKECSRTTFFSEAMQLLEPVQGKLVPAMQTTVVISP